MTAERRGLQRRSLALRTGGRLLMLLAVSTLVVGLVMMSRSVWALIEVEDTGLRPPPAVGLLAYLGGIALLVVLGLAGSRMHRHGRRFGALALGAPVPGTGPIVLYLRPFTADPTFAAATGGPLESGLGSFTTYEEQLREAFRTVGPLVAITRPGEELPQVGATRIAADEQWQRLVLDLFERAALVIITLGGSLGIRWEIEQAVQRLAPQRLLLLTLGDESWYAAGRRELGRHFPRGLPPYPPAGSRPRHTPITAAVWFRADWAPAAVRLDTARANVVRPFESVLVHELRPVFDAVGARWPGARSPLLQQVRLTARGARSVLRGGCLLMLFYLVLTVGAYVLSR